MIYPLIERIVGYALRLFSKDYSQTEGEDVRESHRQEVLQDSSGEQRMVSRVLDSILGSLLAIDLMRMFPKLDVKICSTISPHSTLP